MDALEQVAVLAISEFGGARSHFLAQGLAAVERNANMWFSKVYILVRELQLQIRSEPYTPNTTHHTPSPKPKPQCTLERELQLQMRSEPYHTVDYDPFITSQLSSHD